MSGATSTAKIIPLRRAGPVQSADGISVADAVQMTLTVSAAQGCATRTQQLYQYYLKRFLDWCRGRGLEGLQDVSADDLTDFFGCLLAGGMKPSTIHSVKIPVQKVFTLAEKRDRLARNPWRSGNVVLPKAPMELKPAFTSAEFAALLQAAADGRQPFRDTAILLILIDTGLRVSELCALRVGDIGDDGRVHVARGKGGKSRVAFLGAESLRAWQDEKKLCRGAVPPNAPAFVSSHGVERGFSARDVRDLLERLGARAGVENVHPHRFRRSFAISMLRNGADVVRLRRLMGHAPGSDVLERHYLPLAESDLESLHERCGPVAHLRQGGER